MIGSRRLYGPIELHGEILQSYSPYELVYGKQVLLPIEIQVKTFRTIVQLGLNLDEAQKQRLKQLNELDEIRHDAIQRTILVQNHRFKWHDKFLKKKFF